MGSVLDARAVRYNSNMTLEQLQEQCELGQRELMATNYIDAEKILVEAERVALEQSEFETLSRLYMPLQEARRQRRQRCGEGIVCLEFDCSRSWRSDSRAARAGEVFFRQLLVAGWASIQPALEIRRLQQELDLYVETFLAAVYPTTEGQVIAIARPKILHCQLPKRVRSNRSGSSSPRTAFLSPRPASQGPRQGSYQTYSQVMSMWESLHAPFLAAPMPSPIR